MQKHRTTIIVAFLLLSLTAYVHGLRIADLSDVPASQRPSHIFVTGTAGAAHDSRSALSSLWGN